MAKNRWSLPSLASLRYHSSPLPLLTIPAQNIISCSRLEPSLSLCHSLVSVPSSLTLQSPFRGQHPFPEFSNNHFALTVCSFLLPPIFHWLRTFKYLSSLQMYPSKTQSTPNAEFPWALRSDFFCMHTPKSPRADSGDLSYLVRLSHLKMDYMYQGRSIHKDLLCFASSWNNVIHKLPGNFVFPGTNYNMHMCVFMRGKCAICKHEP